MISLLANPDVIDFIQEHKNSDPTTIALSAKKYPDLPIREIASQIAARQKVAKKLPEWTEHTRLLFPPKENLEQASSEVTAKFKSTICSGKNLLDLTGGSGVDTYFMSKNFSKTVYVEPNLILCELAAYNFNQLGSFIQVSNQTAEEYLANSNSLYDWIYIDPSRRDANKKRLIRLDEYQPNILELLPELCRSSNNILLKASPMLDIHQTIRELKVVETVYCLAVENEMKEVLFHLSKNENVNPEIHSINIKKDGSDVFRAKNEDESNASFTLSEPLKYVYEPNAAIRKAGFFKLISDRFSLGKLHTHTHLYTSESLALNFPGRVFEVEEKFKPSNKSLKKLLPSLKANVITKNYPVSVPQVMQKYRLKEGGDKFLIFCGLEKCGNVCLLCKKVAN